MIDLLRAFRLHDHPHQDEPRIPLGPYLVAKAFSDQGWPQFLLHAHVGARPRLPSLLECCRLTGQWDDL